MLWPLSWRRRKGPKYNGDADFADRTFDGKLVSGSVMIKSEFDDTLDWLKLFREISTLIEAECGVMYLIAPPEESARTPGYSVYCKPMGPGIRKKQLPNIGWATYFGSMFKQELDVDLVRSRGYHVEELAGGYLILMSDSIGDILSDFPTFSRRRAELKKCFRPDLFEITREVGDPP